MVSFTMALYLQQGCLLCTFKEGVVRRQHIKMALTVVLSCFFPFPDSINKIGGGPLVFTFNHGSLHPKKGHFSGGSTVQAIIN